MGIGKNRGSLNLEISLVIALLVLTGVTAVSALSSGISGKFIRDAEAVSLGMSVAPLTPVADWLAQSDGTFRDTVSGASATVTRAGNKTIFTGGRIIDVYPNRLAVAPWSDYKTSGIGYAAVIEETRTNYLINSYFSADANSDGLADGLATYGTAGNGSNSLSLDANPIYGGKAQRISATAGTTSGAQYGLQWSLTDVGTFAAGENATFSGYFWNVSQTGVSQAMAICAYNSSGSFLGINWTPLGTIGSTPVRKTVTYSNLPANTSRLGVLVYAVGGDFGVGDSFSFTFANIQLEKGPFPTSYIPTTAAAVTRAADVVTVPTANWGIASGTFVWVSNVDYTSATDPTNVLAPFGMSGTSGSNNAMNPGYWPMYNGFGPNLYDGSGANNATDGVANALFGVHIMALTFTPGTNNVLNYYNGTVSPRTGTLVANRTANAAVASIGSYNAADFFDGPIQRLTIYNRVLSGAEVASLNGLVNGP